MDWTHKNKYYEVKTLADDRQTWREEKYMSTLLNRIRHLKKKKISQQTSQNSLQTTSSLCQPRSSRRASPSSQQLWSEGVFCGRPCDMELVSSYCRQSERSGHQQRLLQAFTEGLLMYTAHCSFFWTMRCTNLPTYLLGVTFIKIVLHSEKL